MRNKTFKTSTDKLKYMLKNNLNPITGFKTDLIKEEENN